MNCRTSPKSSGWRPVRWGAAVALSLVLTALACLAGISAQALAAEPALDLAKTAQKYFPSDEAGGSPRRIFRLTRDQIDATVAFVLPGYFAKSVKTVMARDPLQTNYEYAELLSFNSANLGPLSGWIKDIAERVRAKPEGVIDCAGSGNSAECLQDKARKFILKATRGDLYGHKVKEMAKAYAEGVANQGLAQATGLLVERVLMSPHFLFRKEQVDGTRRARALPGQDLEALAYIIADVPPGQLKLDPENALEYVRTPADAQHTAHEIMASKEAREKLVRFFKAWLEIREPGEFEISEKVFPAFNAKLSAAMLDETDRFLRAQLTGPAPKLKDITQSSKSFVSKTLEPIYAGTKAADAAGTKPVQLDAGQRFGIFSQPALIASHSGPTDTRPIKRGVFWVRKVMCMEMKPPPQGLDISLYESKGEVQTERQKIEEGTEKKACIGCHKIINPFGFFMESYDALGKWRTTDNGLPVDPAIDIDFLDEGPAKAQTAVEALKILTSSAMFKQCFVRQLFRLYMGRNEEPADDPLLRKMFLQFSRDDEQDILTLVQVLAERIRRGPRSEGE